MAEPGKIGIREGRCDGGCTFWDCGRPAGHAGPCAPPDRPTDDEPHPCLCGEPARPGQETCGDCVCSPEQAPAHEETEDRTVTALEELLTPAGDDIYYASLRHIGGNAHRALVDGIAAWLAAPATEC